MFTELRWEGILYYTFYATLKVCADHRVHCHLTAPLT